MITLLISPCLALAKDHSGSEQFYQIGAGKSALTPNLTYHSSRIKTDFGNTKMNGPLLGAEYEYGLNDIFSVGGGLQYSNIKAEYGGGDKNDSTGFEDWNLFVKGTHAAGAGLFRYRLNLEISPEDSEIKSNGDTNNYTGGNTFTPILGYEMPMGTGIGGFIFSTEIGLGKATTNDKGSGTKSKSEGGEITALGFFYEQPLEQDQMIGGSIKHMTISKTKIDDGSTVESPTPNLALQVYARSPVGAGTLLPSFSYLFTLDDKMNGVKIKSFDLMELSLAYRIEL